jgi:F-type H+-transporting ATPase subunit b
MANAQAVSNAVTGLHAEPTVLGVLNAPAFVALAMLVVIGIAIWQGVPRLITGMLDKRIADIRRQLDEASRLRAEAEATLEAARARTATQAADAAAIIARAQEEADTLRAQAEKDAAELVRRRAGLANDRIEAAERQALGEVRARSAEAAVRTARALIAERNDAAADRPALDRAIAGLGRPN